MPLLKTNGKIKKIIWMIVVLLVLCGGLLSFELSKEKEIPLSIQINIDETIKNDVKILINPNGYNIRHYRPAEYLGETNEVCPLYINGQIQNVDRCSLTKFSDYHVFVKYHDKYSIIRATNPVVMGDDKTYLEFYIRLNVEGMPYTSRNDRIPEYRQKPNDIIETESYFYEKSDLIEIYRNSQNIMSMLNNLDAL